MTMADRHLIPTCTVSGCCVELADETLEIFSTAGEPSAFLVDFYYLSVRHYIL